MLGAGVWTFANSSHSRSRGYWVGHRPYVICVLVNIGRLLLLYYPICNKVMASYASVFYLAD